MYATATVVDLMDIKRVLETSSNCFNAIASLVEDDSSRRKCLKDLEKTRNAISVIDRLISNLR